MNSNPLIDTQILSKSFKGVAEALFRNSNIASVTAKEFLLAQTRGSEKPSYYVLHPALFEGSQASDHFKNAKWAKLGSRWTDQLIIDFGNEFPPYREYSDQALALIINAKERELYKLSISHLPKYTQKYLLDRFQYLIDTALRCLPINSSIVEEGLELFSAFTASYNRKENINNTVNDVLIFATAVQHRLQLQTEDVLLGRFAAEMYGAPIQEHGSEVLLNFSIPTDHKRKENRESKGYVNRGWSYSIRNQRAVSGT